MKKLFFLVCSWIFLVSALAQTSPSGRKPTSINCADITSNRWIGTIRENYYVELDLMLAFKQTDDCQFEGWALYPNYFHVIAIIKGAIKSDGSFHLTETEIGHSDIDIDIKDLVSMQGSLNADKTTLSGQWNYSNGKQGSTFSLRKMDPNDPGDQVIWSFGLIDPIEELNKESEYVKKSVGRYDAEIRKLDSLNNIESSDIPKNYVTLIQRSQKSIEYKQKIIESVFTLGFIYSPLIGIDYSGIAWYNMFGRNYVEAENAARKGIERNSIYNGLYINLAHALLFQGKFNEAKEIYVNLKDAQWGPNDSCKQLILKDFDDIKKAGIDHPDVIKIKALLNK